VSIPGRQSQAAKRLSPPLTFPQESGYEDNPASGLWYNTIYGGT
jgi:hypothetical protein